MARWTVTEGQQEIVIESISPGAVISVDIPSGGPFLTSDPDVIRDLRTKLGLVIGEASQGGSA